VRKKPEQAFRLFSFCGITLLEWDYSYFCLFPTLNSKLFNSGMQLPELQRLIENWNNTLFNGLQLAPQKGVYADCKLYA